MKMMLQHLVYEVIRFSTINMITRLNYEYGNDNDESYVDISFI